MKLLCKKKNIVENKEKEMDFFNVLTMVGGLALFLYGMNVMSEGLAKASGGRLERILEKLTSSPLKAVLLGAAVTGLIQSSSAATVMVVGFVNSGIMKLSQAIGIIMGANIGTTVTSWILSLSGIESSHFFFRLLKPSSFAPVFAVIGVIFMMFSKKEKKKNIGMILVGFSILMVGMDTMSGAVKPLADVPEFTGILTLFSNPLLGLAAGAVLTAIIQSSSASVGILQALCATGAVPYSTALPIIMGQNIGTCITAMLSGVGANKNAKRAALVHLYFNIIGTAVFMAVFYSLNYILKFPFLNEAANAAGIAVTHTVFNVFATLLLLPFSKALERLAYFTVREGAEEKDEEYQLLDSRFLDTPSFAIEQCKNVTVKMAELSRLALFQSMEMLKSYDEKTAEEIIRMEEKVDRYEDELGSYLVKLGGKDLSEKDSHTLSTLLHCIGDFERISDHAVNLLEAAKEMNQKELAFSKKADTELSVFTDALKDIVNLAVEVFISENAEKARMVEPLEEVIDELNLELKARHIRRLRKGKCTIELGFILSDIMTNYERVADHCSNIAVCLIQIRENGFETHEYLEHLKKEDNLVYNREYAAYKAEYVMP